MVPWVSSWSHGEIISWYHEFPHGLMVVIYAIHTLPPSLMVSWSHGEIYHGTMSFLIDSRWNNLMVPWVSSWLLKPAPFKIGKKGDPEQTLQDFVDYVELLGQFLTTNNADTGPKEQHASCPACLTSKAMLVMFQEWSFEEGQEVTGWFFRYRGWAL